MKTNLDIFINGKRYRLNPRQAIGKGGEADIYDIGRGQALKLYKSPEHPDYQLQPDAPEAARQRIAEQQRKLREFPPTLPPEVIAPVALATDDATGQHIVGYTMPLLKPAEVLLRFADRSFREHGGIGYEAVIDIFKHLHKTVCNVHQAGVVLGDFNDLNVLVRPDNQAFLIDADSFQFRQFLCRVFTARFVDPLLCAPGANGLVLQQPHTGNSDWYAFCIMLMQCLLYVDPYGGLYRPKDKSQGVPHHLRPLHRITVFHPDVRYPKPATPYGVLPDELLDFFHSVFEKDHREPFPLHLLENLRWTTCTTCNLEHARPHCPDCMQLLPQAVKAAMTIRGTVTATRLLQTRGVILYANYQFGKLRYLLHENGEFKREDGSVVARGDLDPLARFHLQGEATLIGRHDQVSILRPGVPVERIAVDNCGSVPVFDANEEHIYWLQSGQLWRNGRFGPDYIGDVLAGQTLFWIGSDFGFGWYRAGDLQVAFVFDAKQGSINDTVSLTHLPGQVFDATCVFSHDKCWFLTASQENGRILHHCFVIRSDGTSEASGMAERGDGSWLGSNLHGKCGGGSFLLTATEDGIARIDVVNGQLSVTKTFPDTEPFVHAASRLLPGPDGLHVVGSQDIHLLTIR